MIEKFPEYKEMGWEDKLNFLPSEEKDDSWARSRMMSMINRCASATDYAILISRMMEEVAYREGRQDTNRYRSFFGKRKGSENKGQGSNNSDSSILNLNYDPLPIIPKIIDIITEMGVKRGYYVGVRAGDASSSRAKAQKKYEMLAMVYSQQAGLPNEINSILGVDAIQMPPDLPQSVAEVEEIMRDFKLGIEAGMESILVEILRQSNFPWHYRELVDDLVTNNIGIVDERSDGRGGIVARRIDPLTAIYDMDSVSYCERYFGEVMEYSDGGLIDFASAHGFEATDDVWKDILQKSRGYTIPFVPANGQPVPFRVEQYRTFFNVNTRGLTRVARCVWKSIASDGWRTYHNRSGQFRAETMKSIKEPVDKKDKKIVAKYEEVWEGYLILGANVVFGVTKIKDQGRTRNDYSRLSKTPFPVTVIKPAIEKSIVRRTFPMADQVQLLWLKFQQIAQKIKPPGVFVDLPSLVDGLTNKESPKSGVFDALDVYNTEGVLLGAAQSGVPPISPIPNSVANELTAVWSNMKMLIEEMKQIVGLNEYTDSSTPGSKALIGIGEMAAAGTNNALGRVFESGREAVKRMCCNMVIRLETIARNNGLGKYSGSVGDQVVVLLESCATEGYHNLGVEITSNPDEARMQYFYQELQTQRATYANSGGKDGISVDDVFSILSALENGEGIRKAEMMLRAAVARTKRDAQQMAQMEAERLKSVQIESARAAQEEERKTLELQSQLEIQVDTNYLTLQGQHQIERELVRAEAMMGSEMIESEREAMRQDTARDKAEGVERVGMARVAADRQSRMAKIMADIRMRADQAISKMEKVQKPQK